MRKRVQLLSRCELKNVLRVNNVPHGSLPLDPFLQSSVEFELIRTFTKKFSEIFDTERERGTSISDPLWLRGCFWAIYSCCFSRNSYAPMNGILALSCKPNSCDDRLLKQSSGETMVPSSHLHSRTHLSSLYDRTYHLMASQDECLKKKL